jgi:hypothetical protein
MIGVGVQQFFILVFLIYAIRFHQTITREGALDTATKVRALRLLIALYICVALISVSYRARSLYSRSIY